MAFILRATATKTDDQEWYIPISPYLEQYYTAENIAIVNTMRDYRNALTGSTANVVTSIDGNVFTADQEFDTLENAQSAQDKIYGNSMAAERIAFHIIVKNKVASLPGSPQYTVTSTIIEV